LNLLGLFNACNPAAKYSYPDDVYKPELTAPADSDEKILGLIKTQSPRNVSKLTKTPHSVSGSSESNTWEDEMALEKEKTINYSGRHITSSSVIYSSSSQPDSMGNSKSSKNKVKTNAPVQSSLFTSSSSSNHRRARSPITESFDRLIDTSAASLRTLGVQKHVDINPGDYLISSGATNVMDEERLNVSAVDNANIGFQEIIARIDDARTTISTDVSVVLTSTCLNNNCNSSETTAAISSLSQQHLGDNIVDISPGILFCVHTNVTAHVILLMAAC